MNRKKKYKPRRFVISELPTPERCRKMGGFRHQYVKVGNGRGMAILRCRARWASPLDLYRDRQVIDHAQYQAGLQFGRSYRYAIAGEAACHERSRRIDNPETSDMNEGLLRALACVEQAHAALSADTVNVVIDICAYAQPAENQRAMDKLRRGLGRLALEWGMVTTELCRRKQD